MACRLGCSHHLSKGGAQAVELGRSGPSPLSRTPKFNDMAVAGWSSDTGMRAATKPRRVSNIKPASSCNYSQCCRKPYAVPRLSQPHPISTSGPIPCRRFASSGLVWQPFCTTDHVRTPQSHYVTSGKPVQQLCNCDSSIPKAGHTRLTLTLLA